MIRVRYNNLVVDVDEYNIHIYDSYKVKNRSEMYSCIRFLRSCCDNYVLSNRSDCSLVNEWVGHNNLYSLGLYEDRTRSVDLDYPSKWYMGVIWFLSSIIVL